MGPVAFTALGAVIAVVYVTAEARRSALSGGSTVGAALAVTLGGLVATAGAFALAFDGYAEDAGNRPAHTLWIALPLLGDGVLVIVAAVAHAQRRPAARGLTWAAVLGLVAIAIVAASHS